MSSTEHAAADHDQLPPLPHVQVATEPTRLTVGVAFPMLRLDLDLCAGVWATCPLGHGLCVGIAGARVCSVPWPQSTLLANLRSATPPLLEDAWQRRLMCSISIHQSFQEPVATTLALPRWRQRVVPPLWLLRVCQLPERLLGARESCLRPPTLLIPSLPLSTRGSWLDLELTMPHFELAVIGMRFLCPGHEALAVS